MHVFLRAWLLSFVRFLHIAVYSWVQFILSIQCVVKSLCGTKGVNVYMYKHSHTNHYLGFEKWNEMIHPFSNRPLLFILLLLGIWIVWAVVGTFSEHSRTTSNRLFCDDDLYSCCPLCPLVTLWLLNSGNVTGVPEELNF